MPKIKYEKWRPDPAVMVDVRRAEVLCNQYATRGYSLTLRQLYYQFVASGWIDNNIKSYKRLVEIVSRARLAGMIDWNHLEDRTRNLRGTSHWRQPGSVIDSAAASYRLDKWDNQPVRVEIWVEKEALADVVGQVAYRHDLDYFACRGYVSQSEQWRAGRRLAGYIGNKQRVIILHLGDHDPSGIDMTRDITDRLRMFIAQDYADDNLGADGPVTDPDEVFDEIAGTLGCDTDEVLEVRRIALNIDQVRQYSPPPNPAKLTDSRAGGYVARFGYDSWELDALPPDTLATLITSHIDGLRDDGLYQAVEARESRDRELLTAASNNWDDIVRYLQDNDLT
jgi:hypothetical protein